MKKNLTNINIQGYIEGFYGRLLDWENRKRIVKSLNKNKLNTYFYAPKEDENHRLNWRNKYTLEWRKNFKDFNRFSKKNNINVIAGIAPGLDFNFKKFQSALLNKKNYDFDLLFNKSKQLLDDGATHIALLLDDIPDNFITNFGNKISEGTSHALLANKLSEKLKKDIYFVPRIYADELIKDQPKYLTDLSLILNENIKVFYCGKNVVSKRITNDSKIKKILKNKIIYWDNYYANDYCPRRLFIGPYLGRNGLNDYMINPTGLINTDLLILDIVANTVNKKHPNEDWLKLLNNHNVPFIFSRVKKFFFKPDFNSNLNLSSQLHKVDSKHFKALEYLLWSWKGELAREWYPFIFGLKLDLQIYQRTLTSERIMKTQTIPLTQHINKI